MPKDNPANSVVLSQDAFVTYAWLCSKLGEPDAWNWEEGRCIWFPHGGPEKEDDDPDYIELIYGGPAPLVDVMCFCDTGKVVMGHCALNGIPFRSPRQIAEECDREEAEEKRAEGRLN